MIYEIISIMAIVLGLIAVYLFARDIPMDVKKKDIFNILLDIFVLIFIIFGILNIIEIW